MTELRQRSPRVECSAFLAFVRRKRCCVCMAPAPSQAAHIRMSCRARGKRSTGMAEKPDDRWAVPLCSTCHLDGPEAQHKIGEEKFWRCTGFDPFALAERLWAQFERRQKRAPEQRERVIKRAAKQKRRFAAKSKRLVSRIELRGRLSALVASRPIKNPSHWPPKGTRKITNRRSW